MFQMSSRTGRALLAGSVAGCAWLCAGVLPAVGQQASPPYKIVVDPVSVAIHSGNPAVLRYRYAGAPFKPYVDYFATPAGVNVLRDAPADHKHHHGLMFAVKVDGVNFWEEAEAAGTQLHQALNEVRTGQGGDVRYAGFVDGALVWLDPKSKAPLLFEDRRVEVVQMKDQKASLLTWDSLLTLPEGKKSVTLSGTEYHGLGMRFVASMDKGGEFLNADGKTGVQGTNAVRSRWCAYSAAVNGKPVTVAIFDYPANPRQPATWFTMNDPFAYLAATLNLKNEPLTLPEDRPLFVRYGVALWDGKADSRQIEGLYRQWVDLFKPPPGEAGAPGQPQGSQQPQPGGPNRAQPGPAPQPRR